jgi:hypothetical protein
MYALVHRIGQVLASQLIAGRIAVAADLRYRLQEPKIRYSADSATPKTESIEMPGQTRIPEILIARSVSEAY